MRRSTLALSIAALVISLAPRADARYVRRPPAYQRCGAGLAWGCRSITSGVPPRDPSGHHPMVCGCIPRCAASRPYLITLTGRGSWPDGRARGRFFCGTSTPPAPPLRPTP